MLRDRSALQKAQKEWAAQRTAKRQEDLIALLTSVAQGLTPIDLAVKQIDGREARAYQRGYANGRKAIA